MKIKIYNLVLLAMYVVQIVLFIIFANGGFKAVSAMTLIYVPTTSQIPLAIFIITLLVTVTILVKIVLDLCIKK